MFPGTATQLCISGAPIMNGLQPEGAISAKGADVCRSNTPSACRSKAPSLVGPRELTLSVQDAFAVGPRGLTLVGPTRLRCRSKGTDAVGPRSLRCRSAQSGGERMCRENWQLCPLRCCYSGGGALYVRGSLCPVAGRV